MGAAQPGSEAEAVLADAHVSKRVVRGGGVRIGGFALVNLMGALGSAVLLRHLGVVDYGRFGTVISLMAIASGIADAGMTVTGSRELALRPPGPERRSLLGTIVGIRIALSAAFVLVGLAVGFAAGYDRQMMMGVVLVGIGFLLVTVQGTVLLPLVVRMRNGRIAVSDLVKQAILLIGIVALAAGGAGIVSFFALQVAVGVGALALVPLLCEREDVAPPRLVPREWREVATMALPVAAALVLTVVYVRLLVVMSSILADDVQTGLFVTSARIMEMLGGLPLLISGVVLPVAAVAARDDRGRLGYVLARTTETSLLLGGAIAIALALGARPVTVLLGGTAFAEAAPVLRTQAPAIVTIFLVQSWITFLIADGHQRDLARCVAAGLLALLVAGLVLIGPFGAKGAAAAAVVADVVYAGTTYLAVRRLPGRPVPIRAGFLVRWVAIVAVAFGVGASCGLPPAVAAAAAAAIFVALAVLLRMVPVDFYSALPRFRGGRS